MSSKKRKAPSSDYQRTYESIQDLLVKIKPRLPKSSQATSDPVLVADLFELSALAEKLALQRPKSRTEWQAVADTLDREGTHLWNESSSVRPGLDDQITTEIAALRLAGFRLIEAGLPSNRNAEVVIHMLQLASKTGTTHAEIGRFDVAASVLGSAAKYEECLRSMDDPQRVYQQSKAQATVVYYCGRMEAAWKEGNDSLAHYMLQNITENDNERLALLPARDRLPCKRELLAAKLLDIGRSLLAGGSRNHGADSEGTRAQEAVKWMQKAFALAEQLDDVATAGAMELKMSILRNLARAYISSSAQDPENLSRAETSINELLSSIDATNDQGNAENQELRWGMVAVLKRREAGDNALLEAFRSIVDHMEWTEETVIEIVRDLKTLAHRRSLVVDILRHCLQQSLERAGRAESCVEHILLTLITHCSKDEEHDRAMRDLKAAFDLVKSAEFDLMKERATACVMFLWRTGERVVSMKRHSDAADWFLAGTHTIFGSLSPVSTSRCFRKAALCHMQGSEYAKASNVIRQCPGSEAPSHYIALLAAVKQGLEDEAIQAVRAMVQAQDFDRKMLLVATRLAHESDLKTLLVSVLQELLKSIQGGDGIDATEEAVTLVRCIIRLVIRLMTEPQIADKTPLVDSLIEHFATAKALVSKACSEKKAAVILKDVSWLWRTAYNCAIQGCSDWNDAENKTPLLFSIVTELLELYFEAQAPFNEASEDIHLCIVFASFAAISGRVFAMRKALPDIDLEQLHSLDQAVQACEARIRGVLDNAPFQDANRSHVLDCLTALHVFRSELVCRMKDWAQLPPIIERVVRADSSSVDALEAITDLLWAETACPVDVLFMGLEAIVHASLDRSSLSVSKFSRWLRALCTVLLSRNTAPDRIKAIGYVEQAISVLDDHDGDAHEDDGTYPMEERYWLLATSYNTGIECLHMSLLDEAKRWFEASTTICRHIPDGENRAQKIAETYTHLLNRYSS